MPLEGCLLPLCDEWTRGGRNRPSPPSVWQIKGEVREPCWFKLMSVFILLLEKKQKKEAVCLPLSVITDHSADIFNCLHSSLSVPFLSIPLTFSCSLVPFFFFSIFPLLLFLSLYWLCIYNHHLVIYFFSVSLYNIPSLVPPVMFVSTRYNGPSSYQQRH